MEDVKKILEMLIESLGEDSEYYDEISSISKTKKNDEENSVIEFNGYSTKSAHSCPKTKDAIEDLISKYGDNNEISDNLKELIIKIDHLYSVDDFDSLLKTYSEIMANLGIISDVLNENIDVYIKKFKIVQDHFKSKINKEEENHG